MLPLQPPTAAVCPRLSSTLNVIQVNVELNKTVTATRLARHRVQLEALMRPLLRRWHRGIATSLVRWTDEVVEEGRVHRIPQAVVALPPGLSRNRSHAEVSKGITPLIVRGCQWSSGRSHMNCQDFCVMTRTIQSPCLTAAPEP